MSYFCSECQREHKEGTKIHRRHQKFAGAEVENGPMNTSAIGGESRDRRPKPQPHETEFLEANFRRSVGLED